MKNFDELQKAADVWFNVDQQNMLYEFIQAYHSAKRDIERLNPQVAYLEGANEELKNQLVELRSAYHSAKSKAAQFKNQVANLTEDIVELEDYKEGRRSRNAPQ